MLLFLQSGELTKLEKPEFFQKKLFKSFQKKTRFPVMFKNEWAFPCGDDTDDCGEGGGGDKGDKVEVMECGSRDNGWQC